jgi:hypothetical protein
MTSLKELCPRGNNYFYYLTPRSLLMFVCLDYEILKKTHNHM